MKLLKFFNQPNLTELKINSLPKRKSTRAIIQNEEGEVALLYSNKFNYHEIPGGTVDQDESIKEGMIRECIEETGCEIEIIKELGLVTGLRPEGESYELNEVYGYLAKKVGNTREADFDEDEIEEGFELVWKSIDESIELFNQLPESDNIYRQFIKERGLLFLNEVQSSG